MSAPWRTLASLAWRESRATRRRLLLYMSAISLGVAALVAIDSFAANVTRSVQEQSRTLVGGDVAFRARPAFTPATDSLFDSLATTGVTIAREATFASMVTAVPRGAPDSAATPRTRLSQVRAVSARFPLYGEVLTAPAGRWGALAERHAAIVDPAILPALGLAVGDSVQLGYARFEIVGTIVTVPGDPGMAAAVGPRVYIGDAHLPATRLLAFGSRADHEAFARLPRGVAPARWLATLRPRLDSATVRARTVSESELSITESIDQLANFLGIVGIVALLLGGVGVASGVNAWVTRKIDIVAVLRCVGATSGQVLLLYATQAAAMGLVGATLGAAAGVGLQFLLPRLLAGVLPLDVQVQPEPRAIVTGIALGVWIALAFALRPLLALRRISPLQAIRRSVTPPRRAGPDPAVWAVNALLVATVVGIAATRASAPRDVVGFTGGITVVLALLAGSAALVSRAARAAVRPGWPYVVRQGLANLYRPANQTRAVMLALGFGAFLVTTLYLVQANLVAQLRITAEASRGNLVFFDVQEDQAPGVDTLVRAAGIPVLQVTPIVTMRLAAVNNVPVDQLAPRRATDSATAAPPAAGGTRRAGARGGEGRGSGWALRREYRSTYRDTLFTGETLLAGRWFGATPPQAGEPQDEVSLEGDIARSLGVSLGDVLTWDVQGVRVATRLTSLRQVNWARFEPNFYAVFQRATLAQAPKTFVLLAAAPDGATALRAQGTVVRRFPNVASVDLSLVRKTVSDIAERASMAIRFLALFALAIAVPVLFSAVAATRRERVREGVLLKTLGATQGQIARILLSEYAALGVMGSLTGLVLSFGGAWAIMRQVFDRPFAPAGAEASAIAAAMVVLAVSIGLLSGRDVFRETAMTAIREG